MSERDGEQSRGGEKKGGGIRKLMGQVEGERKAKMMQEEERNGKTRGNPLKLEASKDSFTFIFFGHQFRKAYIIVHWNDDRYGMRFMLTLTLLVVQL